jgi:hypothetical protein
MKQWVTQWGIRYVWKVGKYCLNTLLIAYNVLKYTRPWLDSSDRSRKSGL